MVWFNILSHYFLWNDISLSKHNILPIHDFSISQVVQMHTSVAGMIQKQKENLMPVVKAFSLSFACIRNSKTSTLLPELLFYNWVETDTEV